MRFGERRLLVGERGIKLDGGGPGGRSAIRRCHFSMRSMFCSGSINYSIYFLSLTSSSTTHSSIATPVRAGENQGESMDDRTSPTRASKVTEWIEV